MYPLKYTLVGSGCVPCERLGRQRQEAKASCQGSWAAYTPGPELCYSRSPLKDRKIHKENNILIGSKELKKGLKRNQLLSQNLATANMRKTCKLHLGKFYTDKVLFRNSSTLPVFQVVGIISTNPHVREFFLVIRRGRQDSPFETKIWPSREKHERSKCIIKK